MTLTTLLFAVIIGLLLDPCWAFLFVLIAVLIRLFPAGMVLDLVGPAILTSINKHRR